jgi:hypothetical protein
MNLNRSAVFDRHLYHMRNEAAVDVYEREAAMSPCRGGMMPVRTLQNRFEHAARATAFWNQLATPLRWINPRQMRELIEERLVREYVL